MRKNVSSMPTTACMLATILLFCFCSVANGNETGAFDFEIPALPVDKALNELARQSGRQVLFSYDLVRTLDASPVRGRYTLGKALDVMLEGTGLSGGLTESGVIVISDITQESVVDQGEAMSSSKEKTAGKSRAGVFAVLVALFSSSPNAQESSAATGADANGADDQAIENIVVTGTRVMRDGYDSPTPTSVLSGQEIDAKAALNIADFVNELPVLAGSTTPRSNISSVSSGEGGINTLNLRNIGRNRTLVLLDGQRVGPSTINGYVDINQFPQALVKRVEVVTGGASASWGSDAVAGVVNFVLDKEYEGLKGEVQGGITKYGDDASYKTALTGGTGFLSGRGHLILSGEVAHNEGIRGIGGRKWYDGTKIFFNPDYTATNGLPQLIVRSNSGFATLAPGGIITSGPLEGTYFGEGGTPAQFNYGPIVSSQFMQGGQWEYTDFGESASMDPRTSRQNAFFRMSYELSDTVEMFGQLSFGRATSHTYFGSQYFFGNVTVQPDNAFIPSSIASGVTDPFSLGTSNDDLGPAVVNSERSSLRPVIGINGQFEALGSDWTWDAYAQKSIADSYIEAKVINRSNFNEAVDAVRDSSGVIVCRSTLTNPDNGCVPYNVFGTNVNGQPVRDYVLGTSWRDEEFTQTVYAANLRGDPFSTWAGPVSLATGLEYREEKVSGTNDPKSAARPFFAGNYVPSFGSYNVTEGYIEAVVPVVAGRSFAEVLDLNLAARATDYSVSGFVTTWKLGLTYTPIDDITVRVTRSRDIRAPNLSELFRTDLTFLNNAPDPFRNNESATFFTVNSGNLGLEPEKADTLGAGVVLRPRFIPGFAASVDYYDININDAIGTVGSSVVLNECYAGNTAMCGAITRNTDGMITEIALQPINLASHVARGLDFEASYRTSLEDITEGLSGDITIRGLATHYLENVTDNSIDPPVDLVGRNNSGGSSASTLPYWNYFGSIGWSNESWTVRATARAFSSGVLNQSYIECTSSCPESTSDNRTVDNNHLPGGVYFGLNLAARNLVPGAELFLSVDNLLNKAPAQTAYGPGIGGAPLSVSPSLYDTLGRRFRLGIRFDL